MDNFHLYQCKAGDCGQAGVLDYRPIEIAGISEPTWVPCPRCGQPMESIREADEHEAQALPALMRYGRLGPIFSIRTDDSAYAEIWNDSIDADVDNSASTVPSKTEDPDSDVIFTPEAAALLKATESRTRFLARTGVIPAFKVGKKEWRFSKAALQEWVHKQANGCLVARQAIPASSTPKPSEKPKVTKKRRDIPTDMSPEALRKAIQRIRPAGE